MWFKFGKNSINSDNFIAFGVQPIPGELIQFAVVMQSGGHHLSENYDTEDLANARKAQLDAMLEVIE